MSFKPPLAPDPPDVLVPPLVEEPSPAPFLSSPPQETMTRPSSRTMPSLLMNRMHISYGRDELETARGLDDLTPEARDLLASRLRGKADVESVDARGAVLLQRLEDLLRRADEPALRTTHRPWRVGVVVCQLFLAMG